MTLEELCHRTRSRPATLEEWARLGALGPSWQETTENKWRHITKNCARRAIVMKHLVDSGLRPGEAAKIADETADRLAAGEKVEHPFGPMRILIDPATMDLP
jgi:hypothetical protein